MPAPAMFAEPAAQLAQNAGSATLDVALWFARSGDVSNTLHWLELADRAAAPDLIYLGLRPELDVVHQTDEYRRLVERLNIPSPRD